jgi:hypothetical protein
MAAQVIRWFGVAVVALVPIVAVLVAVAFRRVVKSAKLSQTPAEARIHAQAARARAELAAPASRPVQEMTNAELEQEANDRGSLLPPRK